VTFWVFAYLAHDAALLEAIRTETLPGVVNNSPDVPYLTGQCPRLEALYLEVLRLEMSSSLMRYVTEPTMIGGKLLREGNNVMVPYRQLHYSEDIWGENASAFDPERFLRKKGLSRSSSFRPFGGGQHLCPGRFLAKQAVFTFVALALSRFDVRLDTDSGMGETGGASKNRVQRFPRADESKPGLGALAPVAGDGVILRLKPRTTSVEKPLARS
jgi:cytochrome P450